MAFLCIDKSAFNHNLRYYANKGSKESLIIGLKDNAYGHGIQWIEPLAIEFGIQHCFIRGVADLEKLTPSLWSSILILGSVKTNRSIVPANLNYSVNCLSDLDYFYAGDTVEIKVNTGMNRNGIEVDDVIPVIENLIKKGVSIEGIFTHFSSSDTSVEQTFLQSKAFEALVATLREKFPSLKFRTHAANTAGTEYIDSYESMRVGIGCYGYSNFSHVNRELRPVLSLFAERISSREIGPGASVGYDHNFFKNGNVPKVVSTFDIGYADVCIRSNVNDPVVLNDKTLVIGKPSMDSFSAFTNVEQICVFRNVEELAKRANTIVYDILVNINHEIRRIVI